MIVVYFDEKKQARENDTRRQLYEECKKSGMSDDSTKYLMALIRQITKEEGVVLFHEL